MPVLTQSVVDSIRILLPADGRTSTQSRSAPDFSCLVAGGGTAARRHGTTAGGSEGTGRTARLTPIASR
jgi:hypothetical protein